MTQQELVTELARVIELIDSNAAESPEWIRARTQKALALVAAAGLCEGVTSC